MNGLEFYDKAVNLGLEFIGVDKTKGAMLIRHPQVKATFSVTTKAVEEQEWQTLFEILTSKREAKVLDLFDRIVGYYSLVSQWNKSKLSELDARRKGDYGIKSLVGV